MDSTGECLGFAVLDPSRPTSSRSQISDRERGILAGAMAEVTAAEGHDVTVEALSKHRHGGAAFADSAAYAELTGNKD